MKKTYATLLVIVLLAIVAYAILLLTNSPSKSNVSFEEILFDSNCYPFTQIAAFQHFPNHQQIDTQFVINDQDHYQTLLQYRKGWNEDCSTIQSDTYRDICYKSQSCASLPEIDFSNHTLLGQYTSGHCGTTGFKHFLHRDDKNKTYTFSVKPVNTIRSCSGPGGKSMNWIITPKIPDDYQVLFEYSN